MTQKHFFALEWTMSIRNEKRKGEFVDLRRFMSQFGTTPEVCVKLWDLVSQHPFIIDNDLKLHMKHVLFGLRLLKLYTTEEENADFFGCREKTFRKWSWAVIIALSQSRDRVIQLDNRFLNARFGNSALLTVDGTDFRINEPRPFSSEWYSHKFKGPGLRYEVAVAIQTGYICWTNGPFKPGEYNDITIFRDALINELNEGEQVEADAGYAGEPEKIRVPQDDGDVEQYHIMKAAARARHENVNACFKKFAALTNSFRHDLKRHANVFHAIAVITQLRIEDGELIYGVDYDVVYN